MLNLNAPITSKMKIIENVHMVLYALLLLADQIFIVRRVNANGSVPELTWLKP